MDKEQVKQIKKDREKTVKTKQIVTKNGHSTIRK
jgi:hypothetical protein